MYILCIQFLTKSDRFVILKVPQNCNLDRGPNIYNIFFLIHKLDVTVHNSYTKEFYEKVCSLLHSGQIKPSFLEKCLKGKFFDI